jgi:hypothetical protein
MKTCLKSSISKRHVFIGQYKEYQTKIINTITYTFLSRYKKEIESVLFYFPSNAYCNFLMSIFFI